MRRCQRSADYEDNNSPNQHTIAHYRGGTQGKCHGAKGATDDFPLPSMWWLVDDCWRRLKTNHLGSVSRTGPAQRCSAFRKGCPRLRSGGGQGIMIITILVSLPRILSREMESSSPNDGTRRCLQTFPEQVSSTTGACKDRPFAHGYFGGVMNRGSEHLHSWVLGVVAYWSGWCSVHFRAAYWSKTSYDSTRVRNTRAESR